MLLVGNWKMHGGQARLDAIPAIDRAAAAYAGIETILCVPAPIIAPAAARAAHIAIGAQDCHGEMQGAYTGGISAALLADAGARWVLLGHSEARAAARSSDADIACKVTRARDAGLRPIVCIGERERSAGMEAELLGQLLGSLPEGVDEVTVAYEPIWAIGTGSTPSLEEISRVHAMLRAGVAQRLGVQDAAIRLLYGGSVTATNAADIAALPEVDGLLVGGASLAADSFIAILDAVQTSSRPLDNRELALIEDMKRR